MPILYLLFTLANIYPAELAMLVAIATSLSCIVLTSASAALTQIKAKRVDWTIVYKLLPFLLLGSFSAGFVAAKMPGDSLRVFFGFFIGVVALVMLTSWKPQANRTFPGVVASSAIGSFTGFISGLAGIAGGNVIVPTLIFFNVTAHRATATASTLGVPVAAFGAMGYFLLTPTTDIQGLIGYTNILAFIAIVIGAMLMAPVGVMFAQSVPAERLKKVFGAMLALVSLRMFVESFLITL